MQKMDTMGTGRPYSPGPLRQPAGAPYVRRLQASDRCVVGFLVLAVPQLATWLPKAMFN
jgi:hypothetical protein